MKTILFNAIFLISLPCFSQSIGVENGIVAYYPIVDGSLSDLSENGNHGTLEGEAKFVKDRFGNKDGAISFDGKSASFLAENSTSINTLGVQNSIAISLWFNVDDWGSEGVFPILMKSTDFSPNGLSFMISPKGISIKDRKDALTFNFEISKNRWYHLVGNYAQKNDQQMEWGFYLNNLGMMSPRNYMQNPDLSEVSLYFGKVKRINLNEAETIWAQGSMDEIWIYNRVLTEKEIATLFQMDDRTEDFKTILRKKNSIISTSTHKKPEQVLAIADNTEKSQETVVTAPQPLEEIPQRTIQSLKPALDTGTKVGKYYALIIGNNDYLDPDITPLDHPISDATSLYETLISNYNFDPENVIFLKDAKYEQTIEELDHLANLITSDDNFLMFYAGHGFWDEDNNLGYWLPVDAKKRNKAQWLANSLLKDYLKSINSRHTLLIADACFGGSIFKTRAAFSNASVGINKLYELQSKKAMTSGNLKTVPDESMFLKYLVKRLQENKEDYLSSDDLFQQFRMAVINNSPTTPLYGVIQGVGDEGGEFIFIKKGN